MKLYTVNINEKTTRWKAKHFVYTGGTGFLRLVSGAAGRIIKKEQFHFTNESRFLATCRKSHPARV